MSIHEECGVFGLISDTPAGAAEMIGADSLGFLPVDSLHELTGSDNYCSACFGGDYPTEIPADTKKDRFERKLSEIEK